MDKPVGPLVRSVITGTNADLIAAVAPLYLTGSVLDVTYGRGLWWQRHRPANLTAHDIELDGVDFRSLPEDDGSVDAVCFDPPYVPRQGPNVQTGRNHQFRANYGLVESRSGAELRALVRDGLAECARVTRRWLLVKCCDYTNGSRFWLGHYDVLREAEHLGLRCHDLIVHASGIGPGGGGIFVPIRARRAHSYLLVLAKPKARR